MDATTKTKIAIATDACAKTQIAIATARFARKGGGRLTKREAARLGRLYGGDSHWRFLRTSGDTLARRAPGDFAASWATWFGKVFKHQVATWTADGHRAEVARHLARLFAWYGPSSQIWPGDQLVLSPPRADGCANGWRVLCASDCPSGKCYRPVAPITIAVAEAHPSLKDESPAEYYARVTASISHPGLANTVADSPAGAIFVLQQDVFVRR